MLFSDHLIIFTTTFYIYFKTCTDYILVAQHIVIIDLLNCHLLHMVRYCISHNHVAEDWRTKNMADYIGVDLNVTLMIKIQCVLELCGKLAKRSECHAIGAGQSVTLIF